MYKSLHGIFFLFVYLAATGIFSCNNKDKDQTPNPSTVGRIDSIKSPLNDNPYASVDQSPLDISYYPTGYPELKMNQGDAIPLYARVVYSRPKKKGRDLFGNTSGSLCQYGSPWRLGANEATELEFFKPASINGKKFAAGRYNLYCIPYEEKWVIVFNTNLFAWGLHQDASKDLARIEVPVTKTERPLEFFTMVFRETPSGAELIMAWDNVSATMPIIF